MNDDNYSCPPLPDEFRHGDAIHEVMKAHFNVDDKGASFLTGSLIDYGLLNGYSNQVMDIPRDTAALERIDRALVELSRALSDAAMTPGARMTLTHALTFGPFLEKMPLNKESEEGEMLFDYMREEGKPNAGAISHIEENVASLRKSVAIAKNTVVTSPYAKTSATRINAAAIGLVEGARIVWWQALEKNAPKTLNEASPFGRFLADLFEACGMGASVRAAFNAWAREQKKVHTSGEE